MFVTFELNAKSSFTISYAELLKINALLLAKCSIVSLQVKLLPLNVLWVTTNTTTDTAVERYGKEEQQFAGIFLYNNYMEATAQILCAFKWKLVYSHCILSFLLLSLQSKPL